MSFRKSSCRILTAAVVITMLGFSSCSIFKKSESGTITATQETKPSASSATVSKPIAGHDSKNDKVSTMPIKKEVIRLDSVSQLKVDGMWTLRSINGRTLSAVKGDNEENRPYINFDSRTSKFYANDGCNTINGDFRAMQGDKIELNLLLSTMMLCPDAPYEQEFKLGLANTVKFKKTQTDNENILTLYNDKGSVIMTLVRPMTDFLNGAWQVTSINNNKVGADSDVRMVIDIPEEKVHGNTGCNVFNGTIFVDPDKDGSIQFQQIAVTRMLCPDMSTETSFLVALEAVEYAKATSKGAELLDAHKNVVITLTPLKFDNK